MSYMSALCFMVDKSHLKQGPLNCLGSSIHSNRIICNLKLFEMHVFNIRTDTSASYSLYWFFSNHKLVRVIEFLACYKQLKESHKFLTKWEGQIICKLEISNLKTRVEKLVLAKNWMRHLFFYFWFYCYCLILFNLVVIFVVFDFYI